MALLLFVAGCWWFPPSSTSTTGMAGRIVGPDGAPVEGLLVETVESSVRTDADGRFGLYYKRPDTHVHFIHQGTWFRRRYRPEDAGSVVELRLPATAPREVRCGPHACDVELIWAFSPGFTGKARTRCEPDATTTLRHAPIGEPTVICRDDGGRPLQIQPRILPDRIEIGP